MLWAIKKEIELRKSDIQSPIETLYLGGGTPSILKLEDLESLIKALNKNTSLSTISEFTLECNPDDINIETLQGWKDLGINRLSVGIQSFHEEDLQLMNRSHNARQALECVELIHKAGFTNYTIDLIYGSPSTSNEIWEMNLKQISKLEIPHFSAYALTVEPKTLLAHQIHKGIVAQISDEKQWQQFQILQEFANSNQYTQYEISNFAQPHFEAIHNSNYWKGKAYLGLGPSAHSYDGQNIRTINIANNALYIKSLHKNHLPQEKEVLSVYEKYNESIMIGLRSIYGISENEIHSFPPHLVEYFKAQIKHFLLKGIIQFQDQKYTLNPMNYFQADGITSDLFWVE